MQTKERANTPVREDSWEASRFATEDVVTELGGVGLRVRRSDVGPGGLMICLWKREDWDRIPVSQRPRDAFQVGPHLVCRLVMLDRDGHVSSTGDDSV
jgi:hypothetical protein